MASFSPTMPLSQSRPSESHSRRRELPLPEVPEMSVAFARHVSAGVSPALALFGPLDDPSDDAEDPEFDPEALDAWEREALDDEEPEPEYGDFWQDEPDGDD